MWTFVWMCVAFVLSVQQESGKSETYDQALLRGNAAIVDGRIDEGRIDEFIEAFQICLALRPNDALSAYNLACGYSRKGEIDTALDWLWKSIEWGRIKGPADVGQMSMDPDLSPLLADPRYQDLLKRARQLPQAAVLLVPPVFIDWTLGHRLAANFAEFSPDGSKIFSTSHDGWGRIWDTESGELLVLLPGNLGRPSSCAWVNAGRQVLTGWNDSTLRFWDARTGDLLRVLSGSLGFPGALSRDGRLHVSCGDRGVRLFDLHTGRGLGLDLSAQTYGAGFSPDCTRLATGGADGWTRLFSVWSPEHLAAHKGPSAVFDVAFSPDGRWVVTAGADGMIRWLDSSTLELAHSFRAHRAEVNSVAFSPDGTELLSTSVDRTAKVWNASNHSLRLTLAGHADEVFWGAYRADGKRILTPCRDGTVRMWDAAGGELLLTLGGRGTLSSRTIAFSPGGTLVTFDDRGTREWDAASGRELELRSGSPSVRFRKGREVTCREVTSKGKTLIELDGASVDADAVFLSSNERFAYSADTDGHGRLWSIESGRLVSELAPLSRDGDLTGEVSRWNSACFRLDGTLLATAQNADGAAHLWETTTGEEIKVFRGDGKWAAAVAFDPSGEWLAVAWGTGRIDIWSIASGDRLDSFQSQSSWATSLAFRLDGKALAAGSFDGTVRLWDCESGTNRMELRPLFPVAACAVAFAPDGKRIAAATVDHRVLLWDTENGNLLGTIVPGDEPGEWLAFAPSGYYHGASAAIARARLVQGAISYPLPCFAAVLESPERVAASFTGQEVELPKLPSPPSLVVARPIERTSTVGERVAHVEALATEALAGLAGIEVEQDGERVPAHVLAETLTLENNERLARLDLRLPIPAGANETKITLQAVSARGIKSRPESFVVRYQPPKRELYVLALGVADYADDRLDLAYPVQDVDGLIARLGAQQRELFQDVHVERRVDGAVSNEEVLRLRDEFLLQAKPDDTIVVFVAGHGIRSDTGEYWFLTRGSTPARPYGGIQRSTLEALVTWDKLHATKRVLLLDTCHSGADFGKGTRGERGIAFQQSEVDTLLERSSGLYILAATSDDGFAREQAGNGLFTKALLDGLDGAADAGDFGDKDGTVGIDELMHFARYAVLERSEGRQKPTFPRVEGGENFPLARARGSGGAR